MKKISFFVVMIAMFFSISPMYSQWYKRVEKDSVGDYWNKFTLIGANLYQSSYNGMLRKLSLEDYKSNTPAINIGYDITNSFDLNNELQILAVDIDSSKIITIDTNTLEILHNKTFKYSKLTSASYKDDYYVCTGGMSASYGIFCSRTNEQDDPKYLIMLSYGAFVDHFIEKKYKVFVLTLNGHVLKSYTLDLLMPVYNMYEPKSNANAKFIKNYDSLICVGGEEGVLDLSVDMGDNWKNIKGEWSNKSMLTDFLFINKNEFYVAGYDFLNHEGFVFHTTNQGKNWIEEFSSDERNDYIGISNNTLICASIQGSIWTKELVSNVVDSKETKQQIRAEFTGGSNNIEIHVNGLEQFEDIDFELFDISGRLLYSKTLFGGQNIILNTDLTLGKGIYLLKAKTSKNIFTVKLLK